MVEFKSHRRKRGGNRLGGRTFIQNRLPLLLALLDRETHLLGSGA